MIQTVFINSIFLFEQQDEPREAPDDVKNDEDFDVSYIENVNS